MSDFSEIADEYKLHYKEMAVSHSDIVEKVGDKRHAGGVCGALTMIYLSRYFKSKMGEDPFSGKTFSEITRNLDDVKCKMLVVQLQQLETSRNVVFDKSNTNEVLGGINFFNIFMTSMKSLGAVGLTLQNPYNNDFGSVEDDPPFKNIASYVAKKHGVHLIKFPSHYVGAVVDDYRFKYKFLDVNYGQAITSNAKAFSDFLHAYFNSSTVKGWLLNSGYSSTGQRGLNVHASF